MYMRMGRMALIVGVLTAPAWGQTAGMLSFQGLIKDSNGDPINVPVDLTFRIYDDEMPGNDHLKAGPFVPNGVQPVDGIVSTKFGPVNPAAFDGNPRWLEVRVDGTPLSRIEMATAPATAEQVNIPVSGTDAIQVGPTGNVGIGTTNPQARLHISDTIVSNVLAIIETIGATGQTAATLEFRRQGSPKQSIELTANNDMMFYAGNGSNDGPENRVYMNLLSNGEVSFPFRHVRMPVLTITGGADLAEPFTVTEVKGDVTRVGPGHVVVIDPENPGQLRLATDPYDAKVAGIISGANGLKPGMVMRAGGQELADGNCPVALTGRVWCRCDASRGAIEPGDRLTTSGTPGHAMKVTDNQRSIGAVIGKAMTPLAKGRGLVLVLVQPQ